MLERLLSHKVVEVLGEGPGDFAWSPGAGTVPEALRPLLRKALHPFAERRIGRVEGRGDGVDRVACDDLTDGLHTAQDPCLLCLFEHRLSGGQRIIANVAFEGAHYIAPEWLRMFVLLVIYGNALLIGAE
jgi:hypothetical protein